MTTGEESGGGGACTFWAMSFDFDAHRQATVDPADVKAEIDGGRFVWLDVECRDAERGIEALRDMAILDPELLAELFTDGGGTQRTRRDHGLVMTMTEGRLEDMTYGAREIQAVMTDRVLLTLRREPIAFVTAMRLECGQDFERHASTPSFLLYELWDHLIESYLQLQQHFEVRVQTMQEQLLRHVDEAVFEKVATIGTALLRFRGSMLSAQAILTELTARRSGLISDQTVPYLSNMIVTLERILSEVQVDRDILSEALNLHVSMVTHRTNQTVKRLTAVSIFFLPLMFLCGVWGMNFVEMPELKTDWGYPMFWALVILISLVQLYFLRRKKLL